MKLGGVSHEILYIVNARLPTEKAHGYQISQMCQALMENGHNLKLWHPYRNNTRDLAGQQLRQYYGLRVDITQSELPSIDWHNSFGRCGRWASFMAHYVQSQTFYYSATRRLSRETRADTIYLRDGDLAVWLVERRPEFQSRMIVELHHLPRRQWRRAGWAAALKNVRLVVALTRAMKNDLMNLGVPEGRIHVAPDAVDWETFDISHSQKEARDELALPQEKKIAAYVGKFHTNGEEKGIPEIIQAAGILQKTQPELDFYFIGGPTSRVARYHEIAVKHGVEKSRLIFRGKQPIQQVPLWLKAADVLLMPHPKTDFYSKHVSPLKMFEYMAAQRPIIASKLPAIEDILEGGKTAYLAKAGDASDLARILSEVFADSQRAAEVSRAAKAKGRGFTWANRAQGILDAYEKIEP